MWNKRSVRDKFEVQFEESCNSIAVSLHRNYSDFLILRKHSRVSDRNSRTNSLANFQFRHSQSNLQDIEQRRQRR
jgi:hypothetical protein